MAGEQDTVQRFLNRWHGPRPEDNDDQQVDREMAHALWAVPMDEPTIAPAEVEQIPDVIPFRRKAAPNTDSA